MRRSIGISLVVVALSPVLGGTAAAKTLTAFAADSGHGPSKRQVDRAAAALSAAIKSYLSINLSGPPSDPSTWSAFFDAADARVADLSHKFDVWVSLTKKRIAAGHRPQPGFRTYQQAVGVWVADQEEQAKLSRGCFEQSGSFVDVASAAACYRQMLATNGARWQADGDRVGQLAQRAHP
jgi:hypothetical protein